MAFDPTSAQAPTDTAKRVLLAVLDIIGGDAAWDSEVLYEVISEAMRPKLESDRQMMAGDGPLTYEQFRGLMQRVQGWKGDWLREYMNICGLATEFGLPWRRSPAAILAALLSQFSERPGEAFIRVPVRRIDDVVHAVDVASWTIGLSPEQFEAIHVRGVRGA
ncbi:MAG TPA: hypothetical protein VJP88_08730 [Caulobacteraceae bacterium]|nr:hypothetical protein [Caulobacteraceae bacterium]